MSVATNLPFSEAYAAVAVPLPGARIGFRRKRQIAQHLGFDTGCLATILGRVMARSAFLPSEAVEAVVVYGHFGIVCRFPVFEF